MEGKTETGTERRGGAPAAKRTRRAGSEAGRGEAAQATAASTELRQAHRALQATSRALERRIAEQEAELADIEGWLRATIDTVPDGIVTIDENAVIQSFSAASERLFGYRADEVVGRNVAILMPTPYRDEHDDYVRRYLGTGEKRIIGSGRVVVGQRSDGSTFPMELHVAEMTRGTQRMFLGAVRDISRRLEAERRVQDLQAALHAAARLTTLGEMASGLAHELNQPLSAILSYLDAGRHLIDAADVAVPEKALEVIEKAADQARRAGAVIQRMRQLARQGETERRAVDLNAVVQDGVALASIGTLAAGTRLDFQLGARLPTVLGDALQIQQVLVNLVRNAFDALADVGEPWLIVRTEAAADGFVRVTVRDNGPGLDDEIAARLFQPFVTSKAEGMGIGLSICKSIVESHGGRIEAANNEDGGATFSFTIPVALADAD